MVDFERKVKCDCTRGQASGCIDVGTQSAGGSAASLCLGVRGDLRSAPNALVGPTLQAPVLHAESSMTPARAWTLVFWLSIGLVGLFVAASVAAGSLRGVYFSADSLYVPTLFADLTRWGGRLTDWSLTPAPYFFPDVVFYALARCVGLSVESAQYAACLFQILGILFAARALVARAMPDRAGASALVGPAFLVWFMVFHMGGADVVNPALVHSSHGGALLAALVVWTLCLESERRARPVTWIAVALVSTLAGASDGMFVVTCASALGATAVVYAWAYRGRWKHAPVSIPRCSVAAVCGVAGWAAFRTSGMARTENTIGSAAQLVGSAAALVDGVEGVLRATLFGLTLIAAIAVTVLLVGRRAPSGLRVLALWQLAATGALLVALLYLGEYRTLRYYVVPCNFAVTFVAALLVWRIGRRDSTTAPLRAAVMMTFVAICSVAMTFTTLSHGVYSAPQRDAAACVERVAMREGVNSVLADYWVAKPLMLLSDARAHVVQVRRGLQPYIWIASRGWYRTRRDFGILITNGLDPRRATKLLGPPQVIERCDTLELFVYRDRARARMTRRVSSLFDKALAAPKPQMVPGPAATLRSVREQR